MTSAEDRVPLDVAELACMEFGRTVVRELGAKDLDADAVPRPAVVTVMGHVDHGKTSLLDALRSTSVAAGEAGGITQHIGAFEVAMPGSQKSLTFLDTPGHAAFSAMRARGAAVTDLVVLVVAADDGVMPQTKEALAHARHSGCPTVVALTKCDVAMADPARVRQQLLAEGLELEEAGGDVQVVETAAPVGLGLAELEDALLLQADLLELKASTSRAAEGVVVEASLDKGQGPVATVIIKQGTLRTGQFVAVGKAWGKVRSLRDASGKMLKQVNPGQPAEISGLKGVPEAGDPLAVFDWSARRAQDRHFRQRADSRRQLKERTQAASASEGETEEASARAETAPEPTLNVLIKADVQGSAEAVRDAVAALGDEEVRLEVVSTDVGPITIADVEMARDIGANILAFGVKPAVAAVETSAKNNGVRICQQRVIYHMLQDVKNMLAELAPRVEHEVTVGQAEVLQVFPRKTKQPSAIAGCRVKSGSVEAGQHFRVLRRGQNVFEGHCESIKRHQQEVERVGKGTECGILLTGFTDYQQGDVIECWQTEWRRTREVQPLGN
eukprot:jgi/Astpho2/8954/e_gw1.00133.45.1_t